jgi:hypothetical protein
MTNEIFKKNLKAKSYHKNKLKNKTKKQPIRFKNLKI